MKRKPYIAKVLDAALGYGQSRKYNNYSTPKPLRTEPDTPLSELLRENEALPRVYEVLSEVKHAGPGRYELKRNVGTMMNDAWWLLKRWRQESNPEVGFRQLYQYDLKSSYTRGYEQTLLLCMVLSLLKLTDEKGSSTKLLEKDILAEVQSDMVYYPHFKQLFDPDVDISKQQIQLAELQRTLKEKDEQINALQRDLADARNRADQEERALSTQILLRYLDVMPQGEKVVFLRALSFIEAVAKGEDGEAMKVLREAVEADVKAQCSFTNDEASPTLPVQLQTPEAMACWQKLQEKGFVNEHYQRLPSTTRSQTALIAELFAEHCGISTKWATFERLWSINNLAQEKQKMVDTGLEPPRANEIYEIFD